MIVSRMFKSKAMARVALLLVFTTLKCAFAEDDISPEYKEAAARVELNNSFINRYQFTMWLEASSRITATASTVSSAGREIENDNMIASWRTYLPAYQQFQRDIFGLSHIDLTAPTNVKVERTYPVEFRGVSYAVEVISWQAVPNIYFPATLYRPMNAQESRLPVVISPAGCGEDVATHEDYTSVQRRLANLAISGMIAFFTEGFCMNGEFGSIPGNEHYYSYYAGVSGAGVSTATLELATWLRALDYLQSRPDTDMSRVGVTGYSNGAGITLNLASVTDRVHAIAPVSIALGGQQLGINEVFTDVRNAIFFFKHDYAYFNVHWSSQSAYSTPASQTVMQLSANLSDQLGGPDQLGLASRFGAPRPIFSILGEQEGNDSAARATMDRLRSCWRKLGAEIEPRIDVVPGHHNFDDRRRGLVTRWLAETLRANPLLPRSEEFEHSTPILKREDLRAALPPGKSQTLRSWFAALAQKSIALQRTARAALGAGSGDTETSVEQTEALTPTAGSGALATPSNAASASGSIVVPEVAAAPRKRSLDEARDTIRTILSIGNRGQQKPSHDSSARPILVDELTQSGGRMPIKLQYWLVPVNEHIRTAAVLIGHPESFAPGDPRVVEIRLTTDSLLPTQTELADVISRRAISVSVMVPGYGPTASAQTSVGDLARHIATSFPLLGMGVLTAQRTATLAAELWQKPTLHLTATGVDASNVLLFTAAIDNRFKTAAAHQGLRSFQTLFTAPTEPVVPPTLLLPGLLAEVDVQDLIEMAAPTKVSIQTESDLTEFFPWDRKN
jgi:hypothetical protein